jgi:hypothetical protein
MRTVEALWKRQRRPGSTRAVDDASERKLLGPLYEERIEVAETKGARARVVIDLIASRTEQSAVEIHRRSTGVEPGSLLAANLAALLERRQDRLDAERRVRPKRQRHERSLQPGKPKVRCWRCAHIEVGIAGAHHHSAAVLAQQDLGQEQAKAARLSGRAVTPACSAVRGASRSEASS